jgi:hypothetical protein
VAGSVVLLDTSPPPATVSLDGAPGGLCAWIDRILAEPLPATACRYPVSFIGAAHGDRSARIERLRAAGIEVACFGHGWESGPLDSAGVARVMRESTISLNFANSRGMDQIKVVVSGAGAFLGNLLFAEAPPYLFALIEGVAAGAMLTMVAETMLPEAYHKGGAITGLSTLVGFLLAIFFKTLE